ncbi:MAG: hypothetical protein E6J79_03495, partial [Deltaproteobacteria bacterium]
MSFTTSVGSGICGHLDADGSPNFLPLNCGGLYFGGSGVGVPLPSIVPDLGTSVTKASCNGTTITLSGTTPSEAGGNRCSGGTNHHNSCTADADCPGGKCKFIQCTNAGCLFGPPLPIPNTSHSGSATSSCIINLAAANAAGTADCATGSTTALTLPLSSQTFLSQDLMAMRCSGGSNAGGNCTPSGGCPNGNAAACPGGTCVNDTGRCTDTGAPCCSDPDCANGTCESGLCVAGAKAGKGCITDADCPSSSCRTLIQPCPICNGGKCAGGPNDGLVCTPGNSALNGDYPTSHDCPPPPSAQIGALPISFVLDTGTITRTATDKSTQPNVFCGFCRNAVANQSARRCGGVASGAVCGCNPGQACTACGGAPTCLGIPCTTDADCASVTSFT